MCPNAFHYSMSENMTCKIAYIINARMPTERAHGVQVAKTCEALGKAGEKVELIIPRTFNHITEDLFDYYGVDRVFTVRAISSFDWRRLGHFGFMLQRLYFAVVSVLYVLVKKFDAIYSREILVCAYASIFKRNVVFEDHEPPRSKLSSYFILLKFIPKKVIVARNLSSLYKKHNIKNYIIAPNAVAVEEFDRTKSDRGVWRSFGISDSTPVVLYVGHFYKWKGIYTLLDSAKMLRNASVVLIGGTVENIDAVQKYVEDHNHTNVYLKKFVSRKEITKYTKSADVLVLPNTAKEERSKLYTTPIKLFEYMASSVPIVASNLPSFKEYLRDNENCLLFKPDNSESLAEKVSHILSNKDLGVRLSKKAYGEVKEHTWEMRAKRILKFIYDH